MSSTARPPLAKLATLSVNSLSLYLSIFLPQEPPESLSTAALLTVGEECCRAIEP
jgi:hypothetical protein